MRARALFEKLFLADYFFTIAISKRQKEDILRRRHFASEYVLPANRARWNADPILVDADGETYLFYEAVLGDRGHIEVARVREDCSLDTPMVVLEDDCHYSYPFVFRHGAQWYMIPESSAAGQVRLYRAKEFPAKWELCWVILQEKMVDTTVFEYNGTVYLLTFGPEAGSERVLPRAYQMQQDGDHIKLEEIPWRDYNVLRVRGAGPVFSSGGREYRPAQISREQRYGDAVAFYQVEASDTYRETLAGELWPADVEVNGFYANGLHTYCRSRDFEAIDVRCGVIDWLKPWRVLKRKLGER